MEELLSIIETTDEEALHLYLAEKEPIDVAQEIEELDDEQLDQLLLMLDDDELASILEQAEDKERLRIVRHLDNKRLMIALHFMQKDDIVDLLGDFPIGRRKEVINMMKAGERQVITQLLQYPENSAGGIMTTAYIALEDDLTLQQGLDRIHEIGPKTEEIETIYVTNPRRQLIGWMDIRDFFTHDLNTKIRDVYDEHVISVEPETDQEEAAALVSRYDLSSLPVVSKTQQFLGIITVDDIIDVIQEEADADLLQMAGVSKEEDLDTTTRESVRNRLPWLLVNLATAFLASFTVKAFEDTIAQVVALSAVMTIVSGMGGNAGTQTMSILVRELSNNELDFKDCIGPFLKELRLGFIDGAVTGATTALIVWAMYGNIYLGLIVLIAMIGNLIVSGIFGFLVPVMLKKMNADPAVASSIFVTTATDVLGFFIFLGLARLFLPLLV